MIADVPAKINLSLDVVGRREDGFHLLESVMQTVDLYDRITVVRRQTGIVLDTPGVALCPPEKNTATLAAAAFFAYTGIAAGVALTVKKHIPHQAGMGGGSADAAGVLLLLDRLFDTRLTGEELCRLGLQVGADVPFCLIGGTALVTGIGEKIRPLPALPPCALVIAQPEDGISTADAYAALDRAAPTRRPDHAALLDGLQRGDLSAVCRQAVNVFDETTAPAGVIAIRKAMAAFSPLAAQMTGSGSAVFAIFDDPAAADACAKALHRVCPHVYRCRPCAGGV